MSLRTLSRLTVGLALSLALDACSVSDFVLRPADAGVIQPPGDVPIGPDDRPIAPDDSAVTPTDGAVTPPDGGGTDAGSGPIDTGPPTACNVSDSVARSLPAFNDATIARVRAIRAAGLARGNRADVFAKVGDSITEAAGFLADLGFDYETDYGRYGCLRATRDFFASTSLGSDSNSFNRASGAAMGGWLSSQPLLGDPASPLRAELDATRPLYAIVMIGTNDLASGTLAAYTTNLTRIVTIIEEYGTVPVVSTMPDRPEDVRFAPLVTSFNDAVRALAASRNLPLVDYWQAMQDLPNHGVSDDGIHPSIFRDMGDAQGRQLSDAALRFGYNMRNLTALLMLERLRTLPQ